MSTLDKITSNFCQPGKADVVIGGFWGSEAKGSAAAWLAHVLSFWDKAYGVVSTSAGAQAGHTSIHNGQERVVYHLPTAPLVTPGSQVYLNSGAIINPLKLQEEISEHDYLSRCSSFAIHPNAAIITPECIEAEGDRNSAQTRIASTRKGVGEALARKILRSGRIARDEPMLSPYVARWDLNCKLIGGCSTLLEVPQGFGLSVNSQFWPHCTSRDVTVAQGLSDAQIHPSFLGQVMLVLRCHPIRVGAIVEQGEQLGNSGDCYPDQHEMTWEEIGVKPEITTVTKRVRRVFSWSHQQVEDAFTACRPNLVYLSHADYVNDVKPYLLSMRIAAQAAGILMPAVVIGHGPTTNDVTPVDNLDKLIWE